MDKDEQKNDRANQTVYWIRSVPSCNTRDECLRVMDQIGEDVPGEETSAYELWTKLEKMYQAKTSLNKAILMRRLVNLKLQRGTVAEHMSEFQNLVNQLASIDLHFDNEMQALLLLSSLLESWETLVVSLSNFVQDGKLTMSTVKDALFNEESQKKEMGTTDRSELQALISERSRERGRGHHKSNRRGRPRSQSRGRSFKYFFYDQEGHIRRNCPKYKAQIQSLETASVSVMTDSDNDIFLVSSAEENPDWILNSGSAYHFCRDMKIFSTYATCEGLVRHVPKLQKNLISIGMLDSMGYSIIAKGGILRIFKRNKEMLRGRKTRGLYRLEGSVQTGRVTVRHGSSDIRRKNRQGKQQVHKGTQSKRMDTWRSQSGTRAQGDALRQVQKSEQTRTVRPMQDVHRKVQRKETKSILKSCTSTSATSPKRVSFALDLISGKGYLREEKREVQRRGDKFYKEYREKKGCEREEQD
ncbi:hypothetical protein Acr_00g0051210 [Actinidia rufa]|uniref:Uncharacterized protein n=1 Tax=Actinidia rufa TaxID=165716 RepID=A0A7J0DKQ2_9ERIC|nr:hypothetical protein Acr_00g0051210 [Actinidia rufa]